MVTWRSALLLGVAALTMPLWAAPWWAAAAAGFLVLAASLVDFLLAAPLRDLALDRNGDTTVRLGQSATVRLRLRNNGPRTLRAQIRDAWVPSAGAVTPPERLTAPPGGSATLAAELTPTRRGDRPAVRVTVRSHGPLGLAFRQRAERPATPPWRVRVLPRFASRQLLPEKTARLRVLDGTIVTRGRGQGTEFDALREYVIGDDVRSIDWRASARRSDVMVRTWRPERDRRVVCVLDTGRTSAVRIGDEPRLDAAMDAALLLATLASRAGDQVDLLAVDTAVRASVSGAGRQVLLARLVNALAPLQPALVETDFELVVGEVLRRERKRALIVLFTALEPGALGEGLLPVLPRLVARHKVVVAATHDPLLRELTTRRAETPADAYAAAAGHRALAERDRVAAALRRGGVEVVDAPATEFASAVADAYLTLKANARL
ncbi:DUF58 domain-containing protein [Asanoa sp. WMMD1127]|uniref:DUF58 domain-containing protein n=1 Tax=Asanoa sp. WMMD1127 TaxID=3016107 RepID=UPI0024181210|nr:DUF58 domain-containing protein [Asanoa sp. WMMD1127]MDG4820912.1 DUF58 domain-containing protein [Asanoa sp. WMMD1127]